MSLKKRLLQSCRLYLIADENTEAAAASLKAGSDIVQLRLKGVSDKFFLQKAQELRIITRRLNKLFIVNDRPDIALLSEADGVHLGQDDLSISRVRGLIGSKKIIGRSTHSLRELKDAQAQSADYVGIGPAFKTGTKAAYKALAPEVLKGMIKAAKCPYFVIGGINSKNIGKLIAAGAKAVAVYSAIIRAKAPAKATEDIWQKLYSF